MPHKPNFSAELTNKTNVEAAAAAIGCTHSRGREKGTGSIRAMLEEIGQGEILVMFHQFDDPESLRFIASKVRELASEQSDTDLRGVLSGLAGALDNAGTIKYNSEESQQ